MEEATGLAESIKDLPAQPVIVIIGAGAGASTVAILETRPDAFIFSIDIEPHPEEATNLVSRGLDHRRVVRVLADSGEIDWPFLVDAIYIDGDHREPGIRADCEAWLHKVKPGGVIMFHDYVPIDPPPKNQVARVVDSFYAGTRPLLRAGRLVVFSNE